MQVVENLADDDGIFDAGDDLHGAAAGLASGDVDVEHALEALCRGHGGMTFGGGLVRGFVRRVGFSSLTTPGRSNQCSMFAVGREHAVTNSPGVNLDAHSAPEG